MRATKAHSEDINDNTDYIRQRLKHWKEEEARNKREEI